MGCIVWLKLFSISYLMPSMASFSQTQRTQREIGKHENWTSRQFRKINGKEHWSDIWKCDDVGPVDMETADVDECWELSHDGDLLTSVTAAAEVLSLLRRRITSPHLTTSTLYSLPLYLSLSLCASSLITFHWSQLLSEHIYLLHRNRRSPARVGVVMRASGCSCCIRWFNIYVTAMWCLKSRWS